MMVAADKLSLAQLTLPLAVVFVLAALLKESNNAVTWYDAFVFHIWFGGMLPIKSRLSERVLRGRSTVTSHRNTKVHLLRLNRSVVGGILNGSWWPTMLRTDTALTTRVDKRVVLISIFSTLGLILLAAVSIVTPLGLYENISHGSYEEVEFGYAPDLQPIGKGLHNGQTTLLAGYVGNIRCLTVLAKIRALTPL